MGDKICDGIQKMDHDKCTVTLKVQGGTTTAATPKRPGANVIKLLSYNFS